MYNAITLAHYFVRESQNSKVPITTFKAEFMVYFAHGWHLAIDGRPLIDEPIKAWRHGPVVESVHKFYSKVKDIYRTLDESQLDAIKEMDQEFLDGIWMHYGHLNEMQMLSLCTEDGTPWFATYQRSSLELVISENKIKNHYKILHVSNPEFCDLDDPISVSKVK